MSVIRFGEHRDRITQRAINDQHTREHVVGLTGLEPGTRYFYAIESTTIPSGPSRGPFSFSTSPKPNQATATRIWVLGDSGTADQSAATVRDGYLKYAGTRPADLMLMLGDNAYPSGRDVDYQAAFFEMYSEILPSTPVWSTLGNHDARRASSRWQIGPYYDIFTFPRAGEAGGVASESEAYYAFDFGEIHFICLDSDDSNREVGGKMLRWLEADLEANQQRWTIAFWHHPPYTRGSHDSDLQEQSIEMRENAVPLLEAHGVDLVLSGHSHSYERSENVRGHYGLSPTLNESMVGAPTTTSLAGATSPTHSDQDTVYVVLGSSGEARWGPLDHPVMAKSESALGSLIIDVREDVLSVRFIGTEGQPHDQFSIRQRSGAR